MNPRLILTLLLISATVVSASAALAQDKGSVDPKPLPPLANPNDPKLGAKELFGRKLLPAAMPTRVVGFYAKGCIAGAEGAADQWRDLAGDAAVAQSLLGRIPTWWRCWSGWRPRRTRTPAGRESWSATCRSRAAARC